MKHAVYLAGPIEGLSEHEAKSWRRDIKAVLAQHNIMGISPLRCEPSYNGRYNSLGFENAQADDQCFGTAQAIGAKNEFDVRTCDIILAFLPSLSIGTIIEIAWGKVLNKPVIVVTQEPKLKLHPVIQHCSSWSLDTLDDAVDVITGILGDYS